MTVMTVQACQIVSYNQTIEMLLNTTPVTQGVGPRSWTYQTCNYCRDVMTRQVPSLDISSPLILKVNHSEILFPSLIILICVRT